MLKLLLTFLAFIQIINSLESSDIVLQAIELEKLGQNATSLWLEAAEKGNETAQFMVGVMYAWGLNGLEKDDTKAILNYYFSSLGGYIPAQMALGYRHLRGDGVAYSCKTAAIYLELAANTGIDKLAQIGSIEPGFNAERITPADEAKLESKNYADVDVVDYYHNLASKGDSSATGTLGKIYYYGARGVDRDLLRAYNLLLIASSKGDLSAMTNLAQILLQGVPPTIPKDPMMAWKNFSAAAQGGFGAAYNGLGYMTLFGYPGVVEQDVVEAMKLFSKATDAAVPEAYYNLGAMYSSASRTQFRDYLKAFRYFGLAAQKGSILALHKVAHMTLHGIGTMRSCKTATQYFKSVAERAYFAVEAHSIFAEAFAGFRSTPYSITLERYLRLAEMGYEIGESNAARVIDEITSRNYGDAERTTPLGFLHLILDIIGLSHPPLIGSADALRLYERAAEQGNYKARVRVGDYYYYGHGDIGEPDMVEAAAHYRLASEGREAQANFNLGYQHQYGLGLAKDPHLAKRYYDLAADASADAKFAVAIALTGLWFETTQQAFASGDKFSTDDAVVASWLDWWQGPPTSSESSSSIFNSIWNYQVEYDTMLMILLLGLFFAIGWFREYRNQQRRIRPIAN